MKNLLALFFTFLSYMMNAQDFKPLQYDYDHTFLVIDTSKLEQYQKIKSALINRRQQEAEDLLCPLFSKKIENYEQSNYLELFKSNGNSEFYEYKRKYMEEKVDFGEKLCIMIKDFPQYNSEQYEIALSTLNHSIYQALLNPIDTANWPIYPWYVFSEEVIELIDLPEDESDKRYETVTHIFSIVRHDTAPVFSISPKYCKKLLKKFETAPLPNEFARKTFIQLLTMGMTPPYMLVMKIGD